MSKATENYSPHLIALNVAATSIADVFSKKSHVHAALGGKGTITIEARTCAEIAMLMRSYVRVTELMAVSIKAQGDQIEAEKRIMDQIGILTDKIKGANLFTILGLWWALRSDK